MDTVIKFELPTLYDALQNGYEFTGQIKVIKPAEVEYTYQEGSEEPTATITAPAIVRYACEGCGCFCSSQELVDTSPFDGIQNDWACGGCREKQVRQDTKLLQDQVAKPQRKDFASDQDFYAADENYYRQMHSIRQNCQRDFAKGLLESHSAPPELVALVGVIDKDEANRVLPPVAKAAAVVIPTANEVTVEMVDAGAGIQPGKKARIGSEEVEVTGANGDQVTITRANPQEHPQGEQILFNIELDEGV